MYTMLNNLKASKFDLYLPGRPVASLHYSIDENEILFVYCEAIEMDEAERHCRKLMRSALDESLNRRLKVTVTCPIALKHLREIGAGSAQVREMFPLPGSEQVKAGE